MVDYDVMVFMRFRAKLIESLMNGDHICLREDSSVTIISHRMYTIIRDSLIGKYGHWTNISEIQLIKPKGIKKPDFNPALN